MLLQDAVACGSRVLYPLTARQVNQIQLRLGGLFLILFTCQMLQHFYQPSLSTESR